MNATHYSFFSVDSFVTTTYIPRNPGHFNALMIQSLGDRSSPWESQIIELLAFVVSMCETFLPKQTQQLLSKCF